MNLKDSDEHKEMYCESCHKDGLEGCFADGFCVDCVEYLCATCIRYHKKHKPDHVLLDKNTMPQEICFEYCLEHPNELIKLYCDSCDVCACSSCSVSTHSRCHGVQPLYRLASNFETSEEFKLLNEQLNEAENETNIVRGILEANVLHLAEKADKQNMETSLEDQKDKLIESFDLFKTEINKAVDTMRKDDEDEIQAQLEEVFIIESEILSVKEALRKADHGYKLFIEAKKAKQLMKSLRLTLADIKDTTGIFEYKYEPRDVASNGQFGVFKIGDQRLSLSPVKADIMKTTKARFKVLTRVQKYLLNFTALLWVFTLPLSFSAGDMSWVRNLLFVILIISLLYYFFGSTDLSFIAVCKCVLRFVFEITLVILLFLYSCFFVTIIYDKRMRLYDTYTEIFDSLIRM